MNKNHSANLSLNEASSVGKKQKKPRRRIRLRLGRKPNADVRKNFSENRMYYEKLADKYYVVRTVMSILLALWMIIRTVFTYTVVEADGLLYLNKILKINPANLDARYNTISYAGGSGAVFAFYKNDLAVIGEGKITVYDLSGDRNFHEQTGHSAKAFAVSDKYLALYSPGEKGFSLYNSFSCVYANTFPGSLRAAAVSDSGKFAVCYKENEKNIIEVYQKNFKKEFSFSLGEEKIIYSMALSPNGDKFALTTISMKDGVYSSEFTVYDVSSEKIIARETTYGKKPIAASFFDNGRIFFAAEGSLFFYQANGKKTETIELPSGSYTVFCDENEISLFFGTSNVQGYSSKGALLTAFALNGRVLSQKVRNGVCYVLSDKTIEIYGKDGANKQTCEIRSGVKDFFILDDGSLLICYITETERIVP